LVSFRFEFDFRLDGGFFTFHNHLWGVFVCGKKGRVKESSAGVNGR
jgi:hypothetical protein